jgi:class 3 adenylate cyclase
MNEPINRNVICSVVFLDIIGYSKQPVAQQMLLKNDFNSIISNAIREIADHERIILDTGDGAALCFLADPEDALVVSIRLLDALIDREKSGKQDLLVRIGINLGSVKVVKDLNGQPNIIGDGINVGQRVMSFAKPNQILASRSFYEVVSCLTQEYSRLFQYHGLHKDKHVREHEIYEVTLYGPRVDTNALPAASQPPATDSAHKWEAGTIEALERIYAAHFGSMAKTMVRKAADTTSNLSELSEALASSIANDDERSSFMARASAITPYCQVPERCAIDDAPKAATVSSSGVTIEKVVVDPARPAAMQPAFLKSVEKELANYIGPLARLLVNKAAQRSTSAGDLFKTLAVEIPSEQERKRFMSSMDRLQS